MRIRVRDLIDELQRFPPDDVVEFEVVQVTNHTHRPPRRPNGSPWWQTERDRMTGAQFDRADESGYVVKIQLV